MKLLHISDKLKPLWNYYSTSLEKWASCPSELSVKKRKKSQQPQLDLSTFDSRPTPIYPLQLLGVNKHRKELSTKSEPAEVQFFKPLDETTNNKLRHVKQTFILLGAVSMKSERSDIGRNDAVLADMHYKTAVVLMERWLVGWIRSCFLFYSEWSSKIVSRLFLSQRSYLFVRLCFLKTLLWMD